VGKCTIYTATWVLSFHFNDKTSITLKFENINCRLLCIIDKKQNGKKIPKEHMFIKNLVKQHCSAEDILGVKRRLVSQ